MDRWPLKTFNFSRFWADSPSTEPSPVFSYRFITVYTPYTEWRQSDKEVLFSATAAELCDRDPLCVSGFFHLCSKRLDWRSRPIIRVNCGRRFRGFRQLGEFPPTLFCWQSNTTTVLFLWIPLSTKRRKQLDRAAIFSPNCELQPHTEIRFQSSLSL